MERQKHCLNQNEKIMNLIINHVSGGGFVQAEVEDEIIEDVVEGEDDGEASVETEEDTIHTAAEPVDSEKVG